MVAMDQTPDFPPETFQTDRDQRNWAMWAHLSALATFIGIPSFVGPLVVWLMKKDESEFVAEHARQALNFNLSVLLYLVVGGIPALIFVVLTLGLGLLVLLPVLVIASVGWLVVVIRASSAASSGGTYRYPLTIEFVR